MIDIYHLYQRFCSEVNTSQNGFFRPQTDFERKVNSIQMDIWTQWTSMAEKTNEIRDNLKPFLKHANIITSNKGAFALAPYPDGKKFKEYSRFSSAHVVFSGDQCYPDANVNGGKCTDGSDPLAQQNQVEDFWNNITQYPVLNIEDSRWTEAVNHRTKKPTLKTGIMTQKDDGFQIAPRQISVLVLHYYSKPDYVKFNYTKSPGNVQTGAGDQIIYDAKNPGILLWDETMINEFLKRLVEAYNLFTRDQIGNAIDNSQKRA